MLNQLTKAMFLAARHTHFSLEVAPTLTVELELIEVREGRSSPRQEQFALLFRAPREPFVGQGMWSIQHATLGQFDLFLVPIDHDREGIYLEAVFNRLLGDR